MLKYRFVKRTNNTINTKITMIMIFASINERKGKTNPVIPDRKRKEINNASIDVTFEQTHVMDEGNTKIAARQIGTQ